MFFMAQFNTNRKPNDVRFIDLNYSNHMTRIKSIFTECDETQNVRVHVGNGKKFKSQGKVQLVLKPTTVT